MLEKWHLIMNRGYIFEFEHENHVNVTVKVFSTRGERDARKKLAMILNEKNAK